MGYKNSLAINNFNHFYFFLILINTDYEIKGLARVIINTSIK